MTRIEELLTTDRADPCGFGWSVVIVSVVWLLLYLAGRTANTRP